MMFKFFHGLPCLGPPHLAGTGLSLPQLSCFLMWFIDWGSCTSLKTRFPTDTHFPHRQPLPLFVPSVTFCSSFTISVMFQYPWIRQLSLSGTRSCFPSLADSAKPHGECLIDVYWKDKWETWPCSYCFGFCITGIISSSRATSPPPKATLKPTGTAAERPEAEKKHPTTPSSEEEIG